MIEELLLHSSFLENEGFCAKRVFVQLCGVRGRRGIIGPFKGVDRTRVIFDPLLISMFLFELS